MDAQCLKDDVSVPCSFWVIKVSGIWDVIECDACFAGILFCQVIRNQELQNVHHTQ